MSASDGLMTSGLSAAIARLSAAAENGEVPETRELTALISAAVGLYARAVEQTGDEPPPLTPGVATTEAMVLACALVRSQGLNPFDLALWFAHTRPAHLADERDSE